MSLYNTRPDPWSPYSMPCFIPVIYLIDWKYPQKPWRDSSRIQIYGWDSSILLCSRTLYTLQRWVNVPLCHSLFYSTFDFFFIRMDLKIRPLPVQWTNNAALLISHSTNARNVENDASTTKHPINLQRNCFSLSLQRRMLKACKWNTSFRSHSAIHLIDKIWKI